MFKGLLGKKLGMTQVFDEEGTAVSGHSSRSWAMFCYPDQNDPKRWLFCIQLGYDEVKDKKLTGGELGHLQKKNLPALRLSREFRSKEAM